MHALKIIMNIAKHYHVKGVVKFETISSLLANDKYR